MDLGVLLGCVVESARNICLCSSMVLQASRGNWPHVFSASRMTEKTFLISDEVRYYGDTRVVAYFGEICVQGSHFHY